ncbi:MAG: hypothetical protein CBE00_07320, partial [Planctomycetaceae bacterium TMED240]
KLSRKGKLDQDLPFREPKTFAIFPKCFDEWEFYGFARDFQNNLGSLKRKVSSARFIVHCTQNGRKKILSSLFATFCNRPVQQRPHDCWHNTRLS